MNVTVNLEQIARHFPNSTMIFEGEKKYSYARFNQDAARIASAMRALGIQPGDHVALCAPNAYEWLAFYFGALKAGAVAVTFSHLSVPREIRKILLDSEPKILLTTDDNLAVIGERSPGESPEYIICNNGDMTFAELMDMGTASFGTVPRDRNDVAAILYTGGTTGMPKGAMLTHGNLLTSAFNAARYERTTRKDRALLNLPLNHVFAQVHITHSLVLVGGALVIQNSFDIDKAIHAIEQYRITNFYGVPTIYIRFLKLKQLKEKLRSVRYCFSAASSMAMEVVREWQAATGLNIFEAYGMTESAAIVTYNHYYQHLVGSVGTPVNLVDVQIRDEAGNELPCGEKGEICIRGYNIFRGYLKNPEETAAAFWGNDWFRSGDIGFMNEDGYLYIVDRLKDLVITGGENVYPREVEEILYTWPAVSECAVVGLPDREYGERVAAFLVTNDGCELDRGELKTFLKGQLSGFKVPKEYIVVDAIPKNSAGKPLKRELKKNFS